MSNAKYPVRLIALGPPFDDGTVGRKERPADVPGATQSSHGLGHDPVPSSARSGGRTLGEYNSQHQSALVGQPLTDYDRLQRECGLVKLDNEVLRDLLEVAWTTIMTLAPTGHNDAADAFRARIWAHLHDKEAECSHCRHYIVNHEAASPCAVEDCVCQSN